MKQSVFLFFLTFLIGGAGFSLSLEEAIGADNAAKLRKEGGALTGVQSRKAQPLLAPEHYFIRSLISAAANEVDPSYIVENLYLYAKPAGTAPNAWMPALRNVLFTGMTALSTLAGLRYYSLSEKGMDILYETSSVIDGPDTGNPQPDPVFGTPPVTLTLYARQKDRRFGENIYQYDYYARSDTLILVQQNLTDMNSGLIRMIEKNNLRTILAVMDTKDHLVIYTVSLIKTLSFPGMKARIGASFTNRATAIVEWLSGQADKAFKNSAVSGG
jgi:hypothetical protein